MKKSACRSLVGAKLLPVRWNTDLFTVQISQCRKAKGMLRADFGGRRSFTSSVEGTSRYPWMKWFTSAAVFGGGAALVYSFRNDLVSPAHFLQAEEAKPASKALPATSYSDCSTTHLHKEQAPLGFAPNVPPPITRTHPALVRVAMNVEVKDIPIDDTHTYEAWTFNGNVPGPFIRAREGDTLEVTLYNGDLSGMEHNLDFHCVSGPGGGAPLLNVESDDTKTGTFKLLYPGLFIYHCAVAPIGVHISNGMYGLILVEPKEGLPPVDKEYYVMQSEYYTTKSLDEANPNKLACDFEAGVNENPTHVVFNGCVGKHTDAGGTPLTANTGERVRLYVGNIGPNLVSSFHVIGTIMDKVYREGDLITPPARGIQTTTIPAGGAMVAEFVPLVPGTYTLVDHSIFRVEKGAVAFLNAEGKEAPELYSGSHPPAVCRGCKIHP